MSFYVQGHPKHSKAKEIRTHLGNPFLGQAGTGTLRLARGELHGPARCQGVPRRTHGKPNGKPSTQHSQEGVKAAAAQTVTVTAFGSAASHGQYSPRGAGHHGANPTGHSWRSASQQLGAPLFPGPPRTARASASGPSPCCDWRRRYKNVEQSVNERGRPGPTEGLSSRMAGPSSLWTTAPFICSKTV